MGAAPTGHPHNWVCGLIGRCPGLPAHALYGDLRLSCKPSKTIADDWLGAPMYWSGFDSATTTRLIAAAGLHLQHAEEENVEEFGVPITFLWVIAERPVQACEQA